MKVVTILSLIFFPPFLTSCTADSLVATKNFTSHKNASEIALVWREAFVNKDKEKLVSFSLPESRPGLEKALSNQKSELYKFIYGYDSPYNLLKKQQNLGLFTIPYKMNSEETGINACFYDSELIIINDETSAMDTFQRSPSNNVVCKYFFQLDSRWFTSYEYD